MASAAHETVLEILRKTSKGEGTFPELAQALKSLEDMSLIVPPGEMMRFTQDLDSALEEKGYGKVTMKDAESPRFVGTHTKSGGFVPKVFTDHETAREYAVASGLIQPDENLFMNTRSWISGLHDFLARGFEGVIIDEGTDHQVNLERAPLARLLAIMTLEEFAALDQVRMCTWQGRPHVQAKEDGTRTGFVFDHESTARFWLEHVQNNREGAGTTPSTPRQALETFCTQGVNLLVVNPGLPDERFYNGEEMDRILRLTGGDPDAVRAAVPDASISTTGAADAATTGSVELPEPLKLALRWPAVAPVPPVAVDDAANRGRLVEWQKPIQERSREPWEFLECLAREMNLYVPLHFRNVEGLHWPQFFRHPADEQKTVNYFYSQEARVREALSTSAPESRNFLGLSGIEALRWAWAAPSRCHEMAVDWPDKEASVMVPLNWCLIPLFPLSLPCEDLTQAPDVGLARLTSLPGASGTRPEVVKTLATRWKHLLQVEPPDGSRYTVGHDGGNWIPLFSGQDGFFRHNISTPGFQGKPRRSGEDAPWAGFLTELAEVEGVLLDPASDQPLELRPAALILLDLLARRGPDILSCPTATEVVAEAGRLHAEGLLDLDQAADIVASLPRWWIGSTPYSPETGAQILQLPDQDIGVLFTSATKAQDYLDYFRTLGFLDDTMNAVHLESRWTEHPIRVLGANFSGLCVDPDPQGGCAFTFDKEALAVVDRALDARLKPRIEGFHVDP